MKHTLRALSLVLAMQPVLAAAQQFPTVADHTVIGRIGIGGSSGPSQAIPFAIFNQSILNSLCQTNNAFPVYSTSSTAWVCSTAPAANTVYAGPTTGAAAQPTLRALVGADLPVPGASSLGGVQSLTCSSSNWFRTLSISGIFGCSQPAFTDISGTIAAAQLPNPTASTLGGVKSLVAISHNFLTSISTAGLPTQAQPACADVSDAGVGCNATRGQLPGETTTGSATAGNVGEYIESVIATGSAVSLVSGTAKTVTSITVTAGDWDISGSIQFNTAASTSVTAVESSLSATTNLLDTTSGKNNLLFFPATVPTASSPAWALPVGPWRLSVSGSTTYFLVALGVFTASTFTANGIIRARRVR